MRGHRCKYHFGKKYLFKKNAFIFFLSWYFNFIVTSQSDVSIFGLWRLENWLLWIPTGINMYCLTVVEMIINIPNLNLCSKNNMWPVLYLSENWLKSLLPKMHFHIATCTIMALSALWHKHICNKISQCTESLTRVLAHKMMYWHVAKVCLFCCFTSEVNS